MLEELARKVSACPWWEGPVWGMADIQGFVVERNKSLAVLEVRSGSLCAKMTDPVPPTVVKDVERDSFLLDLSHPTTVHLLAKQVGALYGGEVHIERINVGHTAVLACLYVDGELEECIGELTSDVPFTRRDWYVEALVQLLLQWGKNADV